MAKDGEYERQERVELMRQLAAVEKASLADRKEAASKYFEVAQEFPLLIAERAGGLLNGNYGFGAMQEALRIVKNKRMNRVAALGLMIAALEWQSPRDMTVRMWKKLSKAQQDTLARMISAEIDSYLRGE